MNYEKHKTSNIMSYLIPEARSYIDTIKEMDSLQDQWDYVCNNLLNEIFIASEYDEEITNWVEDGWNGEYDSEYDWYLDHNNGEAQDVVISSIISAIKVWLISYGIDATDENLEAHDAITEKYNFLTN